MFALQQKRNPWPARGPLVGGLLVATLLIVWFFPIFSGAASALTRRSSGDAQPGVLQDVVLRDQRGITLDNEALAGKTLVLNFMFTRCASVCPLQTRELARVQRAIPEPLKSQVRFLSVSVDPEHDTPEALRQFAAANGIDLANWSLAAASSEATRQLTLRLQAVDAREGNALPAAHGTAVYLFDRRGRLMQRYAGAPLDRERLVREVERLTRMNAGEGRTSAP